MPSVRRIATAAVIALCTGLAAAALLGGFSANPVIKALQTAGIIGLVVVVLFGGAIAVGLRIADWSEPESEEDFERLVVRSERLAAAGLADEPRELDFLEPDPFDDEDFEELVRDALDDLPDLLRRTLDHNVAVVISDGGRRRRAYGLYQGDGASRDDHPDRIVIFRDTLRRDFGHDPELLRRQVTITVRHELAHHVGFDELGVRDLGL
ncbi:MAG: metallopeptidase family protein [Solirubrobacteraceae bacterium]|nr:metallopeptidase family protein [Solirubrobacteraceae bacterium]